MVASRVSGPRMDECHHILPVIDLQRGHVVHGVAGQRQSYAPIQSRIVDSSSPLSVARRISEVTGVSELYVADLDALSGSQPPCWDHLNAVSDAGLSVWLDAGIVSLDAGKELLARLPRSRWIVSLEALPSLSPLKDLAHQVPPDQFVFSLDLQHNEPLSPNESIRTLSAEVIARRAIDAGVTTIIVLDLAAVGSQHGPLTLELCTQLKADYPDVELISGGGVKSLADVRRFVEAGCSRVLVATAIHQGLL